ncbi:MAG: DinB family protein [Chitinophagaceae bacterium]|nr:DinB family protein [Chitinophagaceae bacterium]
MSRPSEKDYPAFYHTYIKLVPEQDLLPALKNSVHELQEFLSSIHAAKADYAYAEGKWTVKQLLQHAIDAERIFAYRALCFARGEKKSLPGFEENEYAAEADVSHRNLTDMMNEFLILRQSSLLLFQSFTANMIERKGKANNNSINVLSLGYIVIGHWRHHQGILKERYGI